MPKKNWKNLGAVTVEVFRNDRRAYPSLEDAARAIGEPYISDLTDERIVSDGFYGLIGGTSHIFYDDLGLRIPAWKVREAYANLPNVPCRYPSWHRGYKSHYRKPCGPNGALAEKKAHESIRDDNEELNGRHLMVARRTGVVEMDFWDWMDYSGSGNYRIRNWKKFRRTQYKTR